MILHGPMQAESWSPGGRLNPTTDRVAAALQELYKALVRRDVAQR